MKHSTRKLGNTFTWIGWIGGFFLLALLFNGILEKQFNPNQQVNTVQNGAYQQITLQRNRQGHYLLNGLINNQPVTFLLDTGATTTSIPYHLASKLGLQTGYRFPVQTANGTSYAYSTRVNSLQLGEMTFSNTNASLNPGLKSNEILLGMNILKNIELVQKGETLILRK